MANDFIDTGAAAFGEILVAERRRFVAVVHRPLEHHFVDASGGHSGMDMGPQIVHQTRVDPSGPLHRILLPLVEN